MGGADSIFRLLPRETRSALRRMMHVEPSARCTLTDLLKGRGKTSSLLCGCFAAGDTGSANGSGSTSANGLGTPPRVCEDHCHPEEEDDGDEWLKSIVACSHPGAQPNHTHISVVVEEKHKKRFF